MVSPRPVLEPPEAGCRVLIRSWVLMSDRVPEVGSVEFRALPYQGKLEILSLQLFNPDEYARRTGKLPPPATVASCSDPSIPSSGLASLIIADLPVAFLSQHWAGYQCRFREDWYPIAPWDRYGIQCRRAFSIYAFTFSMLSLESALHFIYRWISNEFYEGRHTPSGLLQACKAYLFLTDYLQAIEEAAVFKPGLSTINKPSLLSPGRILAGALDMFSAYRSLEAFNGDYPIIEDTLELMCIVDGDFLILDKARAYQGRWYYPLIPSSMYRASQFAITTWGWL